MKNSKEYGGSFSVGKRKSKRPFDPKKPLHVVMRSAKALAKYSFFHPNHKSQVNALVYDLAIKYQIKIYNYVNAGNHLHLLIFSKEKSEVQNFFRELARKIAKLIFNGLGKFWTSIVYTKLISWGRQYQNVYNYLLQNELEVLNVIPHQVRGMGSLKFKTFRVLDSA